eukprot:scaffold984_cov84-Amphora_coffeaeformis.AAC.1
MEKIDGCLSQNPPNPSSVRKRRRHSQPMTSSEPLIGIIDARILTHIRTPTQFTFLCVLLHNTASSRTSYDVP